jgi:hypothetical protein
MYCKDHQDFEIKAGSPRGGQRALGQEWIWSIHNFASNGLIIFFEVCFFVNLRRGFSSKNPGAKLKIITL